jgi:hypothetical protein
MPLQHPFDAAITTHELAVSRRTFSSSSFAPGSPAPPSTFSPKPDLAGNLIHAGEISLLSLPSFDLNPMLRIRTRPKRYGPI